MWFWWAQPPRTGRKGIPEGHARTSRKLGNYPRTQGQDSTCPPASMAFPSVTTGYSLHTELAPSGLNVAPTFGYPWNDEPRGRPYHKLADSCAHSIGARVDRDSSPGNPSSQCDGHLFGDMRCHRTSGCILALSRLVLFRQRHAVGLGKANRDEGSARQPEGLWHHLPLADLQYLRESPVLLVDRRSWFLHFHPGSALQSIAVYAGRCLAWP